MADKEIRTDGVDVSECECIIEDYYYQQANNLANGYKHIKNVCELGESGSEYYKLFCKDNPNCHYKQLKRKEQECEELKEEIDDLKEIIQRHDNDNNALLSEFEDDLVDYYRRYKECLAEIKDIAENMNNECFYDDFECKDCDMKNGCTYFNKKQILQKISEVENDR